MQLYIVIKIFRYQLQAFDDNSNEKLFDESKYMIILDGIYDQNQIELSDTKIGSTDSNGIYETESSIWFPTLYSLPEISITDELDIYYGLLDISSPYFNNIKMLNKPLKNLYCRKIVQQKYV